MILLIIAICLVLITLPFWIALFILLAAIFGIFFKFIMVTLGLCVIAAVLIAVWNAKHPYSQIR